ncbi:hypothetical protein [Streptomyces virginiae]|uniref:hypothetical protein n=1 Tax=Streptomyces virginiae TaxID=1961 RepID=UPI000A66DF8F|nr:hypothetical protein [Streptomyces virginiae]
MQLAHAVIDAVTVQTGLGDRGVGDRGSIDGVGLRAGGRVQLAVGGHQPGGDPDQLVAAQEQAVGQAAGEAAAVFDSPGDGGAIGDRADPFEQEADRVRVVLTVNGLVSRLPSASTATATWTCLCGSIPTVTIELSSCLLPRMTGQMREPRPGDRPIAS